MTRISNADQIILLLQSHLQRSERTRKTSAPSRLDRTSAQGSPVERARLIARDERISQDEAERLLVSSLLGEEFGSSAANDVKFQMMIDDILRVLRENESGRRLLDRALQQLTRP